MTQVKRKWWLGAALLLCVAPSSFAVKQTNNNVVAHRPRPITQQVPEGGSAAVYLLGAGVACFGAMFIRSRAPKRSIS